MVIPDDEKTQEQKLTEEILALKTRIKNAEYDLEHMFKGNMFIQKKLDNSKTELEEKEKLIQGLQGNSNTDQTQQIRQAEENIAEKQDKSISKEQEATIEEAIEEEFM